MNIYNACVKVFNCSDCTTISDRPIFDFIKSTNFVRKQTYGTLSAGRINGVEQPGQLCWHPTWVSQSIKLRCRLWQSERDSTALRCHWCCHNARNIYVLGYSVRTVFDNAAPVIRFAGLYSDVASHFFAMLRAELYAASTLLSQNCFLQMLTSLFIVFSTGRGELNYLKQIYVKGANPPTLTLKNHIKL